MLKINGNLFRNFLVLKRTKSSEGEVLENLLELLNYQIT